MILGLLVSVFAVTAFAGEWISDNKSGCKVWNANPVVGESIEWSGACDNNGFASGKGALQWYLDGKPTDRYQGEYRNGKQNGRVISTWANGDKYEGDYLDDKSNGIGTYIWTNGNRYIGEFQNHTLHGFGKNLLLRKNTELIEAAKGKGKWVGDTYVVEGMYANGLFVLSCTSPQNCKQEQAKREAQERREVAERESRERDRVANACNNFYQGKSVGFKPAGLMFFGSVLDAVVMGKGNGNVSIKIVDRHFADSYGKTLEMPCTSDQLQ